MRFCLICFLIASLAIAAAAQPARRFVLGDGENSWESGGSGKDPTVLVREHAWFGRIVEDTTNAPGNAIDFAHRPGWISPLFFSEDENIASRVLERRGSIRVQNVFYSAEVIAQLEGTVNGDHRVAFERKPTPLIPEVIMRNVWVLMDFATPVGIHRVRFYPRNSAVPTPSHPFHNDFLRGYEVWVNPVETDLDAPDLLQARNTGNEDPVVDIELAPQYVRLVKLRSLAAVPFEIDEIEVYGTGYLRQATYLSDIIDLRDRATVGPVRWVENVVGDPLFSGLSVRVRTGTDNTPVLYQQIQRDAYGRNTGIQEVTSRQYYLLDSRDQVALEEDTQNWSPWKTVENGGMITAPLPRRFIQMQVEFEGGLFATREVERLEFEHLEPPIADALVAEIYPRLAEAEKPITFRYAVRLGANDSVRGFDRLEVDTNVQAENIRALNIDGRPVDFEVEEIAADRFSIAFPLVGRDGGLLEFTFDLPIFRFGTTFSGRVYNSGSGDVPQRLEPGNAAAFDPDDVDELSGLFVAIPKQQIGKLVGEIAVERQLFTPNGDGVNDEFGIFFNLLQLVEPAPVVLDLFDLAGRRVHTLFTEEHGIGPVLQRWDGRLADGSLILPGTYVWVLRVQADAFEERHSGILGVAY